MAKGPVSVRLLASPAGQRSKDLKLETSWSSKDVSAVYTRAERLAQSIDLLHYRTGVSDHGCPAVSFVFSEPYPGRNRSTGRAVVTTVGAETVGVV